MSDGGDTNGRRIHEQFNASDSDVTMESADGVLFCLHTQNLKINTGAFPGSEFSTEGDPIRLEENADVVEIVFAYLYPKRYPSLDGMEFTLLARVTEAVEKYEIFPAMNLCALHLRDFIPEHADDILVHAVKHDYPRLINESALALSRSQSISLLASKMSLAGLRAWIRYSEAWNVVFDKGISTIESMGKAYGGNCSTDRSGWRCICDKCCLSLTVWVTKIAKIPSLPLLKTALTALTRRQFPNLVYCVNTTCYHQGECVHMGFVAKAIQDGIDAISPFEQYLNGTY